MHLRIALALSLLLHAIVVALFGIGWAMKLGHG